MLYADLETYSDLDIKKVSLDRYASHPSTRILMCSWCGDSGDVELWQESDGVVAQRSLQRRIATETVVAWNVNFERTLLAKVWKMHGIRWRDAMVDSLYAGLPAGLKDANRTPFFKNESETSKETRLINLFCKPQKDGRKANAETHPDEWELFCQYCKDDTHDTRLILQWIMARFPMPERVLRAWEIDQQINERGMPVDRLLTYRANEEAVRLQAEAVEKLKDLTGLENPNSPAQLLGWLRERGYPYGGLGKDLVVKALKEEAVNVDDE